MGNSEPIGNFGEGEERVVPGVVSLYLVFLLPCLTILSSVFEALSSRISKRIFKPGDNEKELRQTSVEIRNQMKSISMVDEFAKYAKLQRRLNKIDLDLQTIIAGRQSTQTQLQRWIVIAGRAITVLFTAVTMYQFRSTPVFIISEDWFYPLSRILAYPTQVPGAISVITWMFIVRNLTRIFVSTRKVKQS